MILLFFSPSLRMQDDQCCNAAVYVSQTGQMKVTAEITQPVMAIAAKHSNSHAHAECAARRHL